MSKNIYEERYKENQIIKIRQVKEKVWLVCEDKLEVVVESCKKQTGRSQKKQFR